MSNDDCDKRPRGFAVFMLIFLGGSAGFSVPAQAQILAVNNGQTIEVNAHSVCRQVTNSGGPRTMIPIATSGEWASFRNGAPGHISFATCVPPCGGWTYAGSCWYWAGDGQSCSSVCASRGGYNNATDTVAGYNGTNGNCYNLMNHFIGSGAFGGVINHSGVYGEGCVYYNGYTCEGNNTRGFRDSVPTTAGAAVSGRNRICACNN